MEDKEFDNINIIPLVDVMLVLLTIVLMTSTFVATGGIPVELPRASKNTQEILRTQAIEIDRKGDIYLNGRPVSIHHLQVSLGAIERSAPILIRADRELRLQAFVDVLDVVKRLQFKKVSLQTESRD